MIVVPYFDVFYSFVLNLNKRKLFAIEGRLRKHQSIKRLYYKRMLNSFYPVKPVRVVKTFHNQPQ